MCPPVLDCNECLRRDCEYCTDFEEAFCDDFCDLNDPFGAAHRTDCAGKLLPTPTVAPPPPTVVESQPQPTPQKTQRPTPQKPAPSQPPSQSRTIFPLATKAPTPAPTFAGQKVPGGRLPDTPTPAPPSSDASATEAIIYIVLGGLAALICIAIGAVLFYIQFVRRRKERAAARSRRRTVTASSRGRSGSGVAMGGVVPVAHVRSIERPSTPHGTADLSSIAPSMREPITQAYTPAAAAPSKEPVVQTYQPEYRDDMLEKGAPAEYRDDMLQVSPTAQTYNDEMLHAGGQMYREDFLQGGGGEQEGYVDMVAVKNRHN